MLKEILAIPGKPGLYKLISQGANMSIVESLIDKKRIPAYAREKVHSLGDLSIYTEGEDVLIGKVFTAIKTKENGGKISFDYAKAQPDELRAYLAEVLPTFDRERVYPTDIKKMLKWYELLIDNDITDFSEPEAEESPDKEDEVETSEAKTKTGTTTAKRIESAKAKPTAKAMKVKSSPKTSTPKRSTVGAKRGS